LQDSYRSRIFSFSLIKEKKDNREREREKERERERGRERKEKGGDRILQYRHDLDFQKAAHKKCPLT